jgi:hypothetical protein
MRNCIWDCCIQGRSCTWIRQIYESFGVSFDEIDCILWSKLKLCLKTAQSKFELLMIVLSSFSPDSISVESVASHYLIHNIVFFGNMFSLLEIQKRCFERKETVLDLMIVTNLQDLTFFIQCIVLGQAWISKQHLFLGWFNCGNKLNSILILLVLVSLAIQRQQYSIQGKLQMVSRPYICANLDAFKGYWLFLVTPKLAAYVTIVTQSKEYL